MKKTIHFHTTLAFLLGLIFAPTPTMGQDSTGSWEILEPRQPVPRGEAPAVYIDGLIYNPAGFGPGGCCRATDDFQAFNPETEEWTLLPDMPQALDHHMAAAYEGNLYVFARENMWKYDVEAGEWSDGMQGAHADVYAGGAVTLGEYIYVGSGTSNIFRRYSPAENSWEDLEGPETWRDHVAMTTLGGKIYLLGGRSPGERNAFTSVEIYDPETDEWTEGTPMQEIRSGFAAQVIDGKIFVVGGEVGRQDVGNVPAATIKTTEYYDPETDEWTYVADAPVPIHGVGSAVVDGKLYLVGGSDRNHDAVNTGRVMVYTPPQIGTGLISPFSIGPNSRPNNYFAIHSQPPYPFGFAMDVLGRKKSLKITAPGAYLMTSQLPGENSHDRPQQQ